MEKPKKNIKNLNKICGTRLDELKHLQKYAVDTKAESFSSDQKSVIDSYIKESKAKEIYYWILENVSELAPKSFSGFRRMKNSNTDSYTRSGLNV